MVDRTAVLGAPPDHPLRKAGKSRWMRFPVALVMATAAVVLGSGCSDGGSGSSESGSAISSSLQHWSHLTIDASGLDHSPVQPGETRTGPEQPGPGRSSKAMAIVHIAMFEAVNAVSGKYESYTGLPRASANASLRAAIAQAAYDTMTAEFPSQELAFHRELEAELDAVLDGPSKEVGISLGHRAAESILLLRQNDGSSIPEPKYGIDYIASDDPGKWRQDPISKHPLALGARWDEVKPFVLASASQFRAPAPPAIGSPEYAAAYDEVKRLGGDGIITPTERTEEQTQIGIYWAYDGTPSLCAPPRLYNQIAIKIANQMGTKGVDLARLLALVNVAMADAGIAIWESKYYYEYWRPVTGIRESDLGTGPTGLGDGNPATEGDTTFTPLGAPASNSTGPNFTPPFPAYPSGHAGFGGALFEVLRNFYGTDNIAFTFVSDEFNGITKDNGGHIRPLIPRSFLNLSEPEEENGQSRIYLGIHWKFDKTESIVLGRKIGDWTYNNAFLPR